MTLESRHLEESLGCSMYQQKVDVRTEYCADGNDFCNQAAQGVMHSSAQASHAPYSAVRDYMKRLAEAHTFEGIRDTADSMKDLKVLVVGDIIIDEYAFCSVQGITSKDRTFSARYQREECYLGGSLAVAGHIASFSDHVTVASIVGDEPGLHSRILNDLAPRMRLDLLFSDSFRTTVKRRYIERRGIREEYDKILSVNYLPEDDGGIPEQERGDFRSRLEQSLGGFDLVVVTDFGHGLIGQPEMDMLQDRARLLAVNCQTNSSNYGANLITKYRRADIFTVDERELRLATANNHGTQNTLIRQLAERMQSRVGWATLGSLGSVAFCGDGREINTPALTLTVKDTVGAGDAFYSLASLAYAAGADPEVGSFLGNLAGAIAANILGNSRSVQKDELLQYAQSLFRL